MSAVSFTTPIPASAGALVGGKYELLEPIAEGGMGQLWRAVHRGLDREVALKFVAMDEPGTEERVARILCEAELCASVRHRYVVEVFDVDATPGGQPYLVMELLRGETLAQRMGRAPSMPLGDLVRVLAQCLEGLGAVHQAGVIHRDLKPDNIVLAEHPEDGIVPKIVDFGISCRAWGRSTRAKRLTRNGTVLGTPWYMAPEQARALDVSPQTDLYAMGVIAYEALTGRLPFDSDSPVALLYKITSEDAPPVAQLRPDLPPALSWVVARAMARAPEDRFESAPAMRDALLRAADAAERSSAAIARSDCAVVPSERVVVFPVDGARAGRVGSISASWKPASVVDGTRRRGRRRMLVAAYAAACVGSVGALAAREIEEEREAAAASTDVLEPQPTVATVALPVEAEPEPPPIEPETSGLDQAATVERAPSSDAKQRVRRPRAPVAFRRLDF